MLLITTMMTMIMMVIIEAYIIGEEENCFCSNKRIRRRLQERKRIEIDMMKMVLKALVLLLFIIVRTTRKNTQD